MAALRSSPARRCRAIAAALIAIMTVGTGTGSSDGASHSNSGGGGVVALNLGGKTVVVGLNAALQKRFVLPPSVNLVPGSVHRAESIEEGVGGKGQDVAVALSCLWGREGSGKNLALAQFIGRGGEGDAVMGMLEGILGPREGGDGGTGEEKGATTSTGWDSLTVRSEAGLRTCTTIVGSDCATELVEPSGAIDATEMADLLERVAPQPNAEGVAALCVMGSMPPGCSGGTYADIYDRVADGATACLVDSVAGLEPLLGIMAAKRATSIAGKDGAGAAGANVLKLNAAELCRLADVETGGGEADRAADSDVNAAVGGFLKKFTAAAGALDYLAITDGRHPARLVELKCDEGTPIVHGLDVVDLLEDDEMGGGGKGETMLYPIGAGDTVAAGTLAAMTQFQRGQGALGETVMKALSEHKAALSSTGTEGRTAEVAASFAFGLACGSASCLKQENSVLDVSDALRLFSKATASTK